jgi:hypothetical protein
MKDYPFPRTITRGPLKDRTFPTQAAYQRALRDITGPDGPSLSGLKGTTVVRIIDSYETMKSYGVPRKAATAILQQTFGA